MRKQSDRFSFISKYLIISVLILNVCNGSFAQDNQGDKKWHFLAEPYLMFPSLSGTSGIRNLPDMKVEANAGDIFSHLQVGWMMNLEARTDQWAITSDFFYSKLMQDAVPTDVIVSGNVNATQLEWEVAGLRRVASFLEIGVGGRLNSVETGEELVRNDLLPNHGQTSQSASISNTWYDPVIIACATAAIKDKWRFQFRGDLGGFNIGSKFTWQLYGYAGYRFSKLFQLSAGYRCYALNYDKGTGADRFRYDVNMFGPVVKFGFNF